jgi:hypothetical protein
MTRPPRKGIGEVGGIDKDVRAGEQKKKSESNVPLTGK